jgi:hypothetical protein
MRSDGQTLSTAVLQTPELPSSSFSRVDTTKAASSVQTTSSHNLIEESFHSGIISRIHASDVVSIKPSKTMRLLPQESSSRSRQGQSGKRRINASCFFSFNFQDYI